MKLDGVNMETTEPAEAAAEPITQENPSEQASLQPGGAASEEKANGLPPVALLCKDGTKLDAVEPSDKVAKPSTTQENHSEQLEDASTAPGVNPKANGKPIAAVEPKCVSKKPTVKSAPASGGNTRATAAATSQRPANDVRAPTNASAMAVRKTGANAKSAVAGAAAAPKRVAGAAAASASVRSQTRVPDKRSVGQTRTTSASGAAADSAKQSSANGSAWRRTGAEAVGGARPKNPSKSSSVESHLHKMNQMFKFCLFFFLPFFL